LVVDEAAFDDLACWIAHDRKMALRIVRMIGEVQQEPFTGIGKPEPLKHGRHRVEFYRGQTHDNRECR
jgi:toxin YoeB